MDELTFPANKAFWSSAVLGTDGFFWASVPGYNRNQSASGSRQRVFSPEGEYLGVTTFPDVPAANSTARADNGHLLIMYEDDETGAPMITVFRIRSAIRGLKYPSEQ
ncbi:hypothetical protein ACFL3H_08660 [Gemmatimonadota bacterium]